MIIYDKFKLSCFDFVTLIDFVNKLLMVLVSKIFVIVYIDILVKCCFKDIFPYCLSKKLP